MAEQFPKLFQFRKEFKDRYNQLQTKYGAASLKIKIRQKSFTHTYKSRYVFEEDRKKIFDNNFFLSIVSIGTMFFVYNYFRDRR